MYYIILQLHAPCYRLFLGMNIFTTDVLPLLYVGAACTLWFTQSIGATYHSFRWNSARPREFTAAMHEHFRMILACALAHIDTLSFNQKRGWQSNPTYLMYNSSARTNQPWTTPPLARSGGVFIYHIKNQ